MKRLLSLFLIIFFSGCLKQRSSARVEKIYENVLHRYKKELVVLDSDFDYEETRKEILDVIKIRYSDLYHPFSHYKTIIKEDIAKLKGLLKTIKSEEDLPLYEELDSLKEQLKVVLKMVVTSDDYWQDQRYLAQYNQQRSQEELVRQHPNLYNQHSVKKDDDEEN